MKLNPDFKEFIASLNKHEVRYLVVGGYAVALHGHPRYTKDLDVWVWLDPKNAERLLAALGDFGFGSLGLTVTDVLVPEQVLRCRVTTGGRGRLVIMGDGYHRPRRVRKRLQATVVG